MRLRTSCLFVALLSAPAAVSAEGPGPPPRPEPVEALRRVLRAPARDLGARDARLRAGVERVRSLDECRRALLLNEWRDRDLDAPLAALDARHRGTVVERFERGVRAALRQGDLDGRLALLKTLAALDVTLRGRGDAPLARDFTADLADLVRQGPPELRAGAAHALGRADPGPAAAAAALGELLKGPDPALRAAAGEALAALVASAVRLDAARGGGLGHDEAVRAAGAVVPVAAAGLADGASAEARCRCAEAVGRATRALCAAIRAPAAPEEVDDWAAYQGGVEDERAALRPLVAAITDTTGALARAAGDPDGRVRVLARHALEDVAEARARLLRRAASALAAPEGQGDRGAAARSVAFLTEDPLLPGLRGALPALAAGLDDGDVRARLATIDLLETLGRHAAPAAAALVKALADPDRFVRWSAARALGKVRPPDAGAVVPALARLLGPGDADLRLAAAGALREYGPRARAALPALVEAAGASDPEFRLAVFRALESIGGEDAASVAVLSAGLTDGDARVRQVAAQALERVAPSQREAANALLRPSPKDEAPPKAVGSVLPR